jgi:hypothetical protein
MEESIAMKRILECQGCRVQVVVLRMVGWRLGCVEKLARDGRPPRFLGNSPQVVRYATKLLTDQNSCAFELLDKQVNDRMKWLGF